jgi:ParB-like chromosome segregation protein Spo0J
MPTQVPTQSVELWPIERLIEYARNPRKNDSAIDRMCASIREFGFKIPILARTDGEVVDGHLRLKAARKLGINEIPVILCDEWTPAQVKAFRLLVNRSVEWADWDDELLAIELQEIRDLKFDLNLTGFDDVELARLLALQDAAQGLTDEDSVPEVQATPISATGDLWILGDHKLLVGDARNRAEVARLMEGGLGDLVFTDPPYNVDYEGYTEDRLRIHGDHMSDTEFKRFLESAFASYRSAQMLLCETAGAALLP